MSYVEQTFTYTCQLCQDMVIVKKIPELGIVENDENVSLYKIKSQTGLIKDIPICRVCKELIDKIIQEKLSSNKKDRK